MSHATQPLARTTDLKVQSVADETLVYDTRTDKAYVLSPSAAAVWRACNGQRSAQEIARYLSNATPMNEQTVWYALGQLQPLLENPVDVPPHLSGISRRRFLQRAGIVAAAAAVPVVVSIVAPKPAHAQSTTDVCCVCTDGSLQPSSLGCADCSVRCATHNGVDSCAAAAICII